MGRELGGGEFWAGSWVGVSFGQGVGWGEGEFWVGGGGVLGGGGEGVNLGGEFFRKGG